MTNSQLFGLDDQVAAVIGAGSGIGEAVALGCARQGATVRCLDVDAEAAAQTTGAIVGEGGASDAARLDITDGTAVDQAFDDVVERHGSLD
ncbi:MAG: SDR family NAD(P)-dependent oxidoreductase, partial [bacterium]